MIDPGGRIGTLLSSRGLAIVIENAWDASFSWREAFDTIGL